MKPVTHRALLVIATAIGLLAAGFPAATPAQAAVAPWTWQRVEVPVAVAPSSGYAIRAQCPAGYTAITGGLALPSGSTVIPQGQYRQDLPDGTSGWSVIFRNFSTSSGTASVVAECVETADLPPISYNGQSFSRDGNGWAAGEVACLHPGEAVLTGGADWSNASSDRSVRASVPGGGESSWYASGRNGVAGATLYVEVYCADPAYMPGYQTIESTQGGTGWTTNTVTCPVGKRILNGGTFLYAYASYPNLTKWTSTSSGGTTTRAICINAGSPTIALTATSPGPDGSVTGNSSANFSLTGSDPAGYPNSFRCSLNGSVPTVCTSRPLYNDLATGDYQFVAFNTTPDGRTSNLVSYEWTVDRTPPTVTKLTLPKVTLRASAKATWTVTDALSDVLYNEAIYTIVRTDGTATPWTQPDGWEFLETPSVKTPTIKQGETLCVSVRAGDALGNRSAWTPAVCTTRPFDDRALTATNGWNRISGASYWLNTATSTSTSSQTLSRADVSLNRVGIVATKCSGCGAVVVRVGGVKIGRINLDASALAHRRVILLPGFAQQSGAVSIRSVTSGKQITIDGLVALQSNLTPPTL